MPGNPFTDTLDAPAPALATERQLSFLRDLMLEKAQIKGMDMGAAEKSVDAWLPSLSKTYASTQIGEIKQWLADHRAAVDAVRSIPGGPTAPELEDGFYVLPDQRIVKIVHAVHGSGRQYGKTLNTETGNFELLRGAVALVRKGGTALTLDRAKELGHLYGMCIRCGATLTDETSIANGIGPICAQRF